jgi:hypothetical protein
VTLKHLFKQARVTQGTRLGLKVKTPDIKENIPHRCITSPVTSIRTPTPYPNLGARQGCHHLPLTVGENHERGFMEPPFRDSARGWTCWSPWAASIVSTERFLPRFGPTLWPSILGSFRSSIPGFFRLLGPESQAGLPYGPAFVWWASVCTNHLHWGPHSLSTDSSPLPHIWPRTPKVRCGATLLLR